jgi:hypothetical protein
MADKVQVYLTGVQPVNFKNDAGDEIKGCNAFFLETAKQNNEFGVGFLPKKAFISFDQFNVLSSLEFPHLVNACLVTRFTNKGVKTNVESFEPIKRATIN